jgi:phosphopantothenoylcysteine synthetase/decarboxylase
MIESDEMGEHEPRSVTSANGKEDHVFQETYRETIGSKSTKSRGHGYLSNPNRNQHLLQERLFQERLERLEERECEFQQKVKEQLEKQEAEKEAEKEQLKASIRQELLQELQTMIAQPNHHTVFEYMR